MAHQQVATDTPVSCSSGLSECRLPTHVLSQRPPYVLSWTTPNNVNCLHTFVHAGDETILYGANERIADDETKKRSKHKIETENQGWNGKLRQRMSQTYILSKWQTALIKGRGLLFHSHEVFFCEPLSRCAIYC